MSDQPIQCVCDGPGYCELMQRQMHPVRHNECKTRPGYFEMFLSEAGKGHQPAKPETPTECIHRGEVQRTASCQLCGGRTATVEIFACAVHGECTLRRYNTGKHLRSCLTCDERQPAS